jgi:quinol monooxygenase YgiN
MTMLVRIHQVRMDPSNRRNGEEVARDAIVPAARDQKGYRGALLASNAGGQFLLATFWESEEALKASGAGSYYQQQLAKVKDLLSEAPVTSSGEVLTLEPVSGTPRAMRFTIVPVKTDRAQEMQTLSADIAAAAKRQPGFAGWIGVRTDNDEAAGISIWDSPESREKSEPAYLKEAMGKVMALAAGQPRQAVLDVVVCEVPATAQAR